MIVSARFNTVPYVQVFGSIRQGWRTISLMYVFRVGVLRNAVVLAAYVIVACKLSSDGARLTVSSANNLPGTLNGCLESSMFA
jgi:hypothetical protein